MTDFEVISAKSTHILYDDTTDFAVLKISDSRFKRSVLFPSISARVVVWMIFGISLALRIPSSKPLPVPGNAGMICLPLQLGSQNMNELLTGKLRGGIACEACYYGAHRL